MDVPDPSTTMDAAAELRRNPVSKHQIQPEYGDGQTDAGRDCRTRLARRPNSQARTRAGRYYFPVQLTTSRTGSLSRLVHTLAICVTIHAYKSCLSIRTSRSNRFSINVYSIIYDQLEETKCSNLTYVNAMLPNIETSRTLFFFFFNLTYSRWTSSLPSCLWSLRIFPSLPGSRLTIFDRDASSSLLQLVNQ